MDYTNTKMSAGSQIARSPRPMDGIADAANRVEEIAARLADALSRFQSGPPREGGNGTDAIISVSYIDQLSRLHGGLDRLDKLTAELTELA